MLCVYPHMAHHSNLFSVGWLINRFKAVLLNTPDCLSTEAFALDCGRAFDSKL